MKICSKCKKSKTEESFYMRTSHGKPWRCARCKECDKEYRKNNLASLEAAHREWVNNNRDKCREYYRKYYKKNRIKRIADAVAYNRSNKSKVKANLMKRPEKLRARWAVNSAIRAGKLVRQPCSKCGANRANAHHADYAKRLDVSWLCSACHGIEHRSDSH